MRRVLDTGSDTVQVNLLTRDGRRIPMECIVSVLTDDAGDIIGVCGTGRDITMRRPVEEELTQYWEQLGDMVDERARQLKKTNERLRREVSERRAAEDELREEERWFRSLMENSMDVTALFDSDGNLLYITPSVEGILGYDPDTMAGMNVFDLVHPDDLQGLLAAHSDMVENLGGPVKRELRFRHGDGTWRFLEAVARAFLDTSGEVRVMVNARDTTERKKTEQNLLRLNRELKLCHLAA